MTSISPAKGSEEERNVWKDWARSSGIMDNSGNFRYKAISERRRVFRNRLTDQNTNLLGMIESALINQVHFRNSVVERWPETIRIMLNDADANGGQGVKPFESWVGPPGLENRKQAARVWTDLIQYLVLEYHINNITWSADSSSLTIRGDDGYLRDVGLALSDDLADDLMDVVSSPMYGLECLRTSVHEFCMQIIMQRNPSPRNNPLLFWVALLLQTEEFGNQRRLEFSGLKDNLTMREKLEALVHYARVFIMDHAFQTWLGSDSVSKEGKKALESAMNSGGYHWCDNGTPRPTEKEGDPADFTELYWQDFKTHFDELRKSWLVKGSNSPIGVILKLL